MKHEDAMKLEHGQKVIHRRYGVCIVKEVMMAQGELFGVVVRPDNQNGRDLLAKDSRCDVPDMLEDQTRNLSIEKAPVEKAPIEKAPAEPGEKPIDHLTAWGTLEEDTPPQEPKNHFAPDNEGVPE